MFRCIGLLSTPKQRVTLYPRVQDPGPSRPRQDPGPSRPRPDSVTEWGQENGDVCSTDVIDLRALCGDDLVSRGKHRARDA